jgi:hypothetical protein
MAETSAERTRRGLGRPLDARPSRSGNSSPERNVDTGVGSPHRASAGPAANEVPMQHLLAIALVLVTAATALRVLAARAAPRRDEERRD